MYWVGVLVAVLAFAASIALHELGHFIPAKIFKVKVTQFMVGFGPTLFSRKRGETEFGLKALPLGGYIRMIGMTPKPKDVDIVEENKKESLWYRLANDTRAASWKGTQPEDEERAFYRLPPWKKIIIMLGGPFVNLAICVGLLIILFMGIGIPQSSNVVGQVTTCSPIMPTSSANQNPSTGTGGCPPGVPLTPANLAGLQEGDRILSIDGIPTPTWEETAAVIRANRNNEVSFVVNRAGEVIVIPVTLGSVTSQGLNEIGYLGVVAGFENIQQPWTSVPLAVWDMLTASVDRILTLPAGVVETAQTTAAGEARPDDSPVSVVGVTRISGEIVATQSEPPESRAGTVIGLVAGVNLFLFVFNMLPLLPLDGGHAAGAAWESLRRRMAKLRKRPDPGPVDVSMLAPAAYVFAAGMILVSLVIIFADIVNPVKLSG